jgi:soluble lytic murein transglycosylase-like protein
MARKQREHRVACLAGDAGFDAVVALTRGQVLFSAPLLCSLGLIGLLSALTPVAAAERIVADVAFERPLRANELLRTWHGQSRRASETEAVPGTTGSAPTLTIRTLTSKPERSRIRTPKLTGRIAERRARYAGLIEAAAERHRLDPELVHAVIRAESAYDARAKSPAGACGLMQLMPATAQRFGVRDVWDPAQNIEGGVAFLRVLIDRFEGDLKLVLAAYNAGEGAVAKYGNRIPPYRETQHYVHRVLGYLGRGAMG